MLKQQTAGLVQERPNALELRLSCTNPSRQSITYSYAYHSVFIPKRCIKIAKWGSVRRGNQTSPAWHILMLYFLDLTLWPGVHCRGPLQPMRWQTENGLNEEGICLDVLVMDPYKGTRVWGHISHPGRLFMDLEGHPSLMALTSWSWFPSRALNVRLGESN